MPTKMDEVLASRNLVLGFAGMIGVASLWGIWNGNTFPAEPDPTGDPGTWTETELRRWLRNRKLEASSKMTREQLIERVRANLRVTPST